MFDKNIHKLNFTVLRFGSLYGARSKSNNGLNKILSKADKKNQIIYSREPYELISFQALLFILILLILPYIWFYNL